MQTLAINLCLALAVLFGSVGSVLGADFQKGLDATKAGDYETAVKEFTALAKDGNASAQYNLGQFYRRGLGITKDYGEAAMWYLRAAEQGHNKAQYNLGKMYRRGHGVSQDDAEAVKWYRRSAKKGMPLLKTASALCTPKASAFRKVSPNPSNGTSARQTREISGHNII